LIENGSIPWGSKTNSNAIFKTYEVSIDWPPCTIRVDKCPANSSMYHENQLIVAAEFILRVSVKSALNTVFSVDKTYQIIQDGNRKTFSLSTLDSNAVHSAALWREHFGRHLWSQSIHHSILTVL
jgi:hypothetical protein